MARQYIDCREHPQTGKKCTIAISADNEQELLQAAVQHVVNVHGGKDTPELRQEIRSAIKTGQPMA